MVVAPPPPRKCHEVLRPDRRPVQNVVVVSVTVARSDVWAPRQRPDMWSRFRGGLGRSPEVDLGLGLGLEGVRSRLTSLMSLWA